MTKKAVVTGHSKGLGAALVSALEADGWEVLGVSRSAGVELDLASPSALTEWIDGGELERFLADATDIVLINNAGTLAPIARVGEQSAAATTAAINLNVTAPIILTDAVVGLRPAGVPVRVVHVSSGAGRSPYPTWSVYCATKAAVDMHARALADEGHEGVRIAAIAPGIVDTDMQAAIRAAENFPLRERFVEFKNNGDLFAPEESAAKILAILASPSFGSAPVTDVRG